MLQFQCSIHGRSPAAPLSVSFETALVQLGQLSRLYIEPDRSFVWRGMAEDGYQWQVDGNLIGRGQVLDRVELAGQCPNERLDDILRTLGWPEEPPTFQLPRQGLFLTEEE